MLRTFSRLSVPLAATLLLASPTAISCTTDDEPEPPSQDTGATEPDCNQAFQDALDAGLCRPPGSLTLNFDLGSTNYIYVDDPYFEAIGAVGVFGPGVGAGAGGAAAGSADSIARVIETNGTCEILCVYDVINCNDEDPVCVGFFGEGCLYCNDETVTIDQCQAFLNGCGPGPGDETGLDSTAGGEAGTAGTEGGATGTADSTD